VAAEAADVLAAFFAAVLAVLKSVHFWQMISAFRVGMKDEENIP
jgi:hypothetical protein